MESVRYTQAHAERLAHLLDDAFHIPGTRMRFGLDPLIGLIPIIGDSFVTGWGAVILFIARRLHVPSGTMAAMALHLMVNGLVGSIPIFGDAFSFGIKCHAKNAARLLRTVKQGEEGACPLVPPPVCVTDIVITLALVVPVMALLFVIGLWLWQHDLSFVSFLFPPPYSSRSVR
jgi:hypothetical protein